MAMEMEMNMEDIVQEVLLRLPVKSLIRCKTLSKQWCNFISCNQTFRQSYLSRNKRCSLMLGFFFSNNPRYRNFPGFTPETIRFLPTSTEGRSTMLKKWKRDDDHDHDETFTTSAALHLPLDETLSFLGHPTGRVHVFGSSNGFLLCTVEQVTPRTYFICNPVNKQCLSLPTPINPSDLTTHGFICHATHPSVDSVHYYKVVRVICNPRPRVFSNRLTIEILSSDSPHQWKPFNLIYPFSFFLVFALHFTTISEEGVIYLQAFVQKQITEKIRCLVIFDQRKKECLQFMEFPPKVGLRWTSQCLGQSGGLTLYARNERNQLNIWVLNDKDGCSKEWSLKYKVNLETIVTKENYPEFFEDLRHRSFSNIAFHPENPRLLFLNMDYKMYVYDVDNSTLDLVCDKAARGWKRKYHVFSYTYGLIGPHLFLDS